MNFKLARAMNGGVIIYICHKRIFLCVNKKKFIMHSGTSGSATVTGQANEY